MTINTKLNIFRKNLKNDKAIDIKILAGDASTRKYWRWNLEEKKMIVAGYLNDEESKKSLERFVYWKKKYDSENIRVPEIFEVDYSHGLILQEDVGDRSLQVELANCSSENELNYMLQSIDLILRISKIKYNDYVGQLPEFNESKLQYEINNSLKYFVGEYLGVSEWDKYLTLWKPLLKRIAEMPKVLCHRDFHSRNLMVAKKSIVVIDFQDTMLGPVQYDLCSFLDDCYVCYAVGNYQQVMRKFFESYLEKGLLDSSYEKFFIDYHLVKIQRQYKALGSFCYIWSTKKSAKYLRYLSYVVESIRSSFDVLNLKELVPLKEKMLSLYYEN